MAWVIRPSDTQVLFGSAGGGILLARPGAERLTTLSSYLPCRWFCVNHALLLWFGSSLGRKTVGIRR
jgi:hypothetical protein